MLDRSPPQPPPPTGSLSSSHYCESPVSAFSCCHSSLSQSVIPTRWHFLPSVSCFSHRRCRRLASASHPLCARFFHRRGQPCCLSVGMSGVIDSFDSFLTLPSFLTFLPYPPSLRSTLVPHLTEQPYRAVLPDDFPTAVISARELFCFVDYTTDVMPRWFFCALRFSAISLPTKAKQLASSCVGRCTPLQQCSWNFGLVLCSCMMAGGNLN